MILPTTVTQQRGVSGNFYYYHLHADAPRDRARTQHVESVQKATEVRTIREMVRFECDKKEACSAAGLLERLRAAILALILIRI